MGVATKSVKELEALGKEKSELLVKLGQQMHKLVRDGVVTDEAAIEMSGRISKIDVEICIGSGNRIPSRGDCICPICSEPLASATVAFCGKCGANIKEFYSSDMVPCHMCSQLIQTNANYCPICGVRRTQQ